MQAMLRALLLVFAVLIPVNSLAGEPIFEAAKEGDVAAIEKLLASGTVVDARDRDQATPLIAAALAGQVDAAKLLIARGADVMARNSGGFTPLHAAAYSGSAEVAALLLEHKVDIDDAANKAGATPLLVAAETNHPKVVEMLIAKGADATRPESHGFTALTRAFWKGHTEMVQLLQRHGLTCQPSPPLLPHEVEPCLGFKY